MADDSPPRSLLVPALAGCGCGGLTFAACAGLGPTALIGAAWGTWEAGYRYVDASAAVPAGLVVGLGAAVLAGVPAALVAFFLARRLL